MLSYHNEHIWRVAILEVSNMATRGGAQLGSRKKSIDKGHIYHWSKNDTCRPIWTIKMH